MSAIRNDKSKPPNQKDIPTNQATAKGEIGHMPSVQPAEIVDGNVEVPYDGSHHDFVTVTLPQPVICGVPIEDMVMLPPAHRVEVVPTARNQQQAVASPNTKGGGRE